MKKDRAQRQNSARPYFSVRESFLDGHGARSGHFCKTASRPDPSRENRLKNAHTTEASAGFGSWMPPAMETKCANGGVPVFVIIAHRPDPPVREERCGIVRRVSPIRRLVIIGFQIRLGHFVEGKQRVNGRLLLFHNGHGAGIGFHGVFLRALDDLERHIVGGVHPVPIGHIHHPAHGGDRREQLRLVPA